MDEEKNIHQGASEFKNPTAGDKETHNENESISPYTSNNDKPEIELSSTEVVEKTSAEQTIQPLTENMEVHQHPHKHHSKKWKDYLFEFLMLFLAVTSGFFVENTREYYIEHERVKQFSKQLLADLRLDSLLFEKRNRDIQSMQKGYDSLLFLLTKKKGAADREILEVLLPLTFTFDIPATSTTYNQMKTSGSLRYIENFDLTAQLQQYYDVLLPRSIKISETALNYFSQNINSFYLKHIRIQDYDSFNDSLINKKPLMMERSGQTDQELANIMGGYRSLLKIQEISMNNPALEKIKETIEILKEEYHLE